MRLLSPPRAGNGYNQGPHLPPLKIDSYAANMFCDTEPADMTSPLSTLSSSSAESCESRGSNVCFTITDPGVRKNMDYAFPPFPTAYGPAFANVYHLAGFPGCPTREVLQREPKVQMHGAEPRSRSRSQSRRLRQHSDHNVRRQKQEELRAYEREQDKQQSLLSKREFTAVPESPSNPVRMSPTSAFCVEDKPPKQDWQREVDVLSNASTEGNHVSSEFGTRESELEPTDSEKTRPPRILSLLQAQVKLNSADTCGTRIPGGCRGCGQKIKGKSVRCADGRIEGKWHKECFCCSSCATRFPSGEFYVHAGKPYCGRHYHELNGSVCLSCGEGVEGACVELEDGGRMHCSCFQCCECQVALTTAYYEVDGQYVCEVHATQTYNKLQGQRFAQFFL